MEDQGPATKCYEKRQKELGIVSSEKSTMSTDVIALINT